MELRACLAAAWKSPGPGISGRSSNGLTQGTMRFEKVAKSHSLCSAIGPHSRSRASEKELWSDARILEPPLSKTPKILSLESKGDQSFKSQEETVIFFRLFLLEGLLVSLAILASSSTVLVLANNLSNLTESMKINVPDFNLTFSRTVLEPA